MSYTDSNFYQTKVDEFKAAIKSALKAGDSYEFEFFREEKHLFDSQLITRADVLATIFEDSEWAHAFANTYHKNVVDRDTLQTVIINKAIELIASEYAVEEAQAYCANQEAA